MVYIFVSQFAYLYYALKVCTLFVKKKYIFCVSVAEEPAFGRTTSS